ncbi:MAG: hypothetical protein ACTHOF_01510 [Flavisolibacter sp.]
MKRLGWTIIACFLSTLAFAQSIDFKDLMNLLDLNQNKVQMHLQKKGFKQTGVFDMADAGFSKIKQEKNETVIRRFKILPAETGIDLIYETNSRKESAELEKEIIASGFDHATLKKDSSAPVLYQKQNLVIQSWHIKVDSSVFYVFKSNKKSLPRQKDLAFAEDLLQLDSHEYLADVFGKQNVKKDLFYLSATDAKKCSVIFPNTSRQAIFLWKDEENMRDISFIIIGEQLSNSNKNVNAVMLSDWRSNQGIYCGMGLREIQNLNNAPISFYNWRTESAGFLAPQNKGAIDFEKLKPVFSCMNCGFLYVDNSKDIIQSGYAIDENQKVYVGSFVVVPEKRTDMTRQTSLK